MTLHHFPTVLYDQIFETLIKAARAGYSVPENLLYYVLHTYIWERAFGLDDVFQLKEKLIRPEKTCF